MTSGEARRIAFLTDKAYPYFTGGYEVRVFEIARRLANTDEVRIFTSLSRPSEMRDAVLFQRTCSTRFTKDRSGERSLLHTMLYSARQLRSPFDGWAPDVIIIEAIPYLHLPAMQPWLRRTRGLKVLDVCEAWGSFHEVSHVSPPFSTPLIGGCLGIGIRGSNAVVAISSSTRRSLEQNYGALDRPVIIVPLGIDPGSLAKGNRVRTDSADSMTRDIDVIGVGRLVPQKRFADLVRALGLLRQAGWRGKALILGAGPLMERLRRDTRRNALADQLKVTGFVDEALKNRLLARSKLFVLASEREGFSLATLEAMARGVVPVVAKPERWEVYGVSDLVSEGVTGYSYPTGDASRLKSILESLLADPNKLLKMSAAAAESALRFDWNVIVKSFRSELCALEAAQ